MELLLSIQRKMEEREQRWNVQQQFRDNTYEVELKEEISKWRMNCSEERKSLKPN